MVIENGWSTQIYLKLGHAEKKSHVTISSHFIYCRKFVKLRETNKQQQQQ